MVVWEKGPYLPLITSQTLQPFFFQFQVTMPTKKTLHLLFHLLVYLVSTYSQTCPSVDPYLATIDEDDADVTVGAVLRMHGPGKGVYGCGPAQGEGLHYYEALRWAIGALNRNSGEVAGVAVNDSFVPGIKIGEYFTC